MSSGFEYSFLIKAEEEFISAIRWYADINTNLGETFVQDFDNTIAQICKQPTLYPVFAKSYRKLNFDKFPYKIVYKIQNSTVVIVAVAHHKRHPRYWKKRK